jgi:rhodanese-related sulfurtransferase
VTTIDRTELEQLIRSGGVTVLEALPHAYHAREHIPGALDMPHDQVDELAPVLVPDRSATIAVYCSNAACQNSTIAARRLEQLGYSDVRTYAEGKEDWIGAGLPVEVGVAATP